MMRQVHTTISVSEWFVIEVFCEGGVCKWFLNDVDNEFCGEVLELIFEKGQFCGDEFEECSAG